MPLFLLLFFCVVNVDASVRPLLNVLKSDANGLVLDVFPPALPAEWATAPSGMARLDSAQLPFISRLVAAPADAQLDVRVRRADYEEFTDVEMASQDPYDLVASRYVGLMRGIPTHALQLYPYSYDAEYRTLRIYTHLRIEIRFIGGRRAKAAKPAHAADVAAFLNAEQAASFSAPAPQAKIAQDSWYEAARPWIRMHVETDGLYRIDRAWLARMADVDSIDPHTLQLFYRGEEQPLHVAGESDGRFDEGDYLLFYGRFRRGPRDHESTYGRENAYWLTWGSQPGRRYAERSGAPNGAFPQVHSFWHTEHFERDLYFDMLTSAPDAERDHWFWTLNNKPLTATKPDVPSAAEFPGDLLYPDMEREYDAQIRVALHGASDLAHHTVLKLNAREVLVDTVWGAAGAGMIDFLCEATVRSSLLKDGRNRILLQVFADQAKFDLMWFNWFEVDYFRRFIAHVGYLEFAYPPSEGHRIEAQRFTHPHIEIFELHSAARLVDFSIADDSGAYAATFEDRTDGEAHYVMADSASFLRPRGIRDTASNWRGFPGADYLIISDPRLVDAAERLAEHRRATGLSAAAISSQDLYDEFNYGLMDAEAIASFIEHAYHRWAQRPRYVLLLGDDTWDYRNIIGGGRPTLVPSLYYQSRGRGLAPSDFLYALIDGDDLLPDLSIGRLAASSPAEADAVVDKIIAYDTPAEGAWRTRAIYLANHHPKAIFSQPSDSLAARYTEPIGLQSVKIYNPDEGAIPNATGRSFVDALNDGALLLNFNGHGSPGTMQSLFTLSLPDWGYLAQVQNGRHLPLILALSCLNGLFSNPTVTGLAEAFTNRKEGGAIAYISASAKSFVAQNDLLSDRFYDALLAVESLPFGAALDVAKAQVLSAHSSWVDAVLTMQLVGDPAQKLALPAAPDYVALALDLYAEPVRGHSTVEIGARLVNYGRLSTDSLRVELLLYDGVGDVPDTLQRVVEPPFSGERALSFTWPVGALRGPVRLELRLDGSRDVAELDEDNNVLSRSIDILAPLMATPIFPADNAATSGADIALEAAVPADGGPYFCEFEWATAADFAGAVRSPLIEPSQHLAVYRPALSDGATYFWRVRLRADGVPGPWSAVRSLHAAAGPRWSQRGVQLALGADASFALRGDALGLSSQPLPLRPDSTTREDGFTVRDHAGSGIVATDGTWLYAKRWYNDDSTVYPGTDYFTRIGTGLNGTFRTGNFGAFGDSTTAGISATYHSDGYIYNESGKAFELERLSLETGVLDTVSVPDGLLEWKFGRVEDGHSLITSDGQYIYNVSMSTALGARNAWSVRVFDPAQGWALLREFTSPPTENGFTYEWTDGILADGEHLYFIEWQGQQRIRMVDAENGAFIDEWQSDQGVTRVITGQYDWINNKVWLGDLLSSAVFRYSGLERVRSGELVSMPIGPVAQWQALSFTGRDVRVDIEVPNDGQWQPLEEWGGLDSGPSDLSALDANAHPLIRLRARFNSPEAELVQWNLDFAPRPSLQIARAEGREYAEGLSVEIVVRNLSDSSADDAVLSLEQSDRREPIRQIDLPPLARGQNVAVRIDSLALPPRGAHLFAEVIGAQPDVDPEDNRRRVALFVEGHLPVHIALWPEDRPFLSGDPLRAGQGLLISAPDVRDGQLEVRIDGAIVEPDSLIDAFPALAHQLFRPTLAPDAHHLEARLLRGEQTLGSQSLTFYVDDALRVRNALVYPHPVREEAHFTYVLSQQAEVAIEVFGLSGRLIQRLGPFDQSAGFAQVDWDGRDAGGQRLASGTYLYRIVAHNGSGGDAVFRGALVLMR